MPGFAVSAFGSVIRGSGLSDFSPEQVSFLTFGRGVDTTRMRDELGFVPAYSTDEAFADFGRSLPTGIHAPGRSTSPDAVLARLERTLTTNSSGGTHG